MSSRREVLRALGGVTALGPVFAGCLGTGNGGDGTTRTGTTVPTSTSMTVSSPAFSAGASVPARFTCDGEDVSPPLSFDGVPGDAAALALVVDDPDAPGGTFTHWLLWNLPPDVTEIPANVPTDRTVASLDGARQGMNDFGAVGYRGPCPPSGDDAHTYRFTLYALGGSLDVEAGAGRGRLSGPLGEQATSRAQFTAQFARKS